MRKVLDWHEQARTGYCFCCCRPGTELLLSCRGPARAQQFICAHPKGRECTNTQGTEKAHAPQPQHGGECKHAAGQVTLVSCGVGRGSRARPWLVATTKQITGDAGQVPIIELSGLSRYWVADVAAKRVSLTTAAAMPPRLLSLTREKLQPTNCW